MAWIKVISPDKAMGKLQKLYRRVAGKNGQVDRILQVHSLRPASLEGHMALYKNVLHHRENQLPKWLLETLGCYVSLANGCDYCVAHHGAGLARLLDRDEAENIMAALKSQSWHEALPEETAAMLDYAQKLTKTPQDMTARDLEPLRKLGYSDSDILEANQVVAYFAYANRTVLGLGVDATGETLGLAPSHTDAEDWNHQ